MTNTPGPAHAVELLDRAFNNGDLETILSFYEDAAIVVAEPGKTLHGKTELRTFFESVLRSGAQAKQLKTRVLEADGIALFLSQWTLVRKGAAASAASEQLFSATTVFRKQPDGTWAILIDSPCGPMILDWP